MAGHQAFIGLGSNRGDKKKIVYRPCLCSAAVPDQVILKRSSWYLTEPVGLEDPEWFINGVVLLETPLSPEGLLDHLLGIEDPHGPGTDR